MKLSHAALAALFVLLPATLPAVAKFNTQPPARALTIADRVAAQKAIEQVYWNHRIWPKDNKASKPPLSAVLSDAALRAKVERYVAGSKARSAAELQAEVERMKAHTHDPQMLGELFDALGNDPVLIAETLARQTMMDRPMDVAPVKAGTVDSPLSASATACGTEAWQTTSLLGVPTARYRHTAVWTGAEMIVWGGTDGTFWLNSGGRYNPATDSWTPTSTGANVPAPRNQHSAVWTGTEMIVWGGFVDGPMNSGGRYNPAMDSWLPTSMGADVPAGRYAHSAVWTGTEMIVWGGSNPSLNTGGRYNPSTDTWRPTSTGAHVPSPRFYHGAVWTGTEMLIWGDLNGAQDGGRYDPSTDSWMPISIDANTPHLFDLSTLVWTGNEMIAWGGCDFSGNCPTNAGGRYRVATDSWLPVSHGPDAPAGRDGHSAVWTGTEMIVWSGYTTSGQASTGGRYNPVADTWIPTLLGPNVPDPRDQHTAVWTGTEMIVWGGGSEGDSVLTNTGGRYSVPLTCDDNNPCTDDSCDPVSGCVHTPLDGVPCDDGNLCTSGETCHSGTCTPSVSGLNHPAPKSSGYYKKLCEKREHGQLPYQGDQPTDADALCVGDITLTFAGITTVDDICNVLDKDRHGGRHHGGPGDGPDGKDCDKGEDELIATALNICRARVCEEQNLDSRCHGNASTTVGQSFAGADTILDDAARTKDTCKAARCELREINNGHALELNSLALAQEAGAVRVSWLSMELDDGARSPDKYEVWRRALNSSAAFAKIGTTTGLTFLDTTAGTGSFEYEVSAEIP
jgi:hypothetical protein